MADPETFRSLVAFLYQRSGRAVMSENELANAMSLDLKWSAPKAARELVAGLVRAGWLERDEDGDLVPTFEVRGVKVPIGFRPPGDLSRDVPPPGDFQSPPHKPAAAAPSPPAASAPTQAPPASPPLSPAGPAEEPETLLGRLLQTLAQATGEEPTTWVARMDQVVQRTQDAVTPEVALLVAAAKEGLDLTEWLEEARAASVSSG